MSTEHVYSVNFLSMESLKSVKIASFVPKDFDGKRPPCLGQQEEKLKNLVVVFPITTGHSYPSGFRASFNCFSVVCFIL